MKITRGKHIIHISSDVLSLLSVYKQNRNQPEAGGIILGKVDNDGSIFITRISLPNRYDKSSRYLFERDKSIAKIIIDYEFYNSNRTVIYLGEWHTHPENTPNPSSLDIEMLKKQYRNNRTNEPFVIMMIQGVQDLYIGIYDGKKIISE